MTIQKNISFFMILMMLFLLEIIMIGCTSFNQYKNESENICKTKYEVLQNDTQKGRIYPLPGETITTAHLSGLPEIIKRYLKSSGLVGQKMVSSVQIRQTGKIRTKPDNNWMKVKAVETFNIGSSEFLWYADVRMNPFISLTGLDVFKDGHGSMKIKIYDLFSVVDASGPSIDQGGMIRYLNELMWLPMAYLHPSVNWAEEDKNSIEVSLTINGTKVSGIIEFNNDSLPINFEAKRYMDDGKGQPSLETWTTPLDSWREYHGIILPEHGYATWQLENGEFRYIELTLEDVEFGVTEIWRP
jgi:Family of unknown function (DUF6544)